MPAIQESVAESFAYRDFPSFSEGETIFKLAVADYAAARLLPKLRARGARHRSANRYTGLGTRLADSAIYLQGILTNDTEWGGLGFDFARLVHTADARYDLSIRSREDWRTAETWSVAEATQAFAEREVSPRSTDWVQIAGDRTFEECVELLAEAAGF